MSTARRTSSRAFASSVTSRRCSVRCLRRRCLCELVACRVAWPPTASSTSTRFATACRIASFVRTQVDVLVGEHEVVIFEGRQGRAPSATSRSKSRPRTCYSTSSADATNEAACSSPPTKPARSGATSSATRCSRPQRSTACFTTARPGHPGRQLPTTTEETNWASQLDQDQPLNNWMWSGLVA